MIILIISTILSFLSIHTKVIIDPVLKWFSRTSADDLMRMNELKALQSTQQKLSMVNNFVEYSKIQRKINKLIESLKESRSKNANDYFTTIGITYGFRIIIIFTLFIICLYNRKAPLFYLGDSINLFPFGYFISFPNGGNSVSYHFWIMCCTAFSRLIKL